MVTGVRPAPPSGPGDRLPRQATAANRGREVRLGLLGVLVLLLLVVGIPAALVLLVGYPLPRTAPTRDWLTQSFTATLVINVLACVVWLVWAHFTVCLLTEWRAVRRGRLPAHVALGGGNQLLARRLVATVLLLAGAAMAVPHGGAGAPAAAPVTISQQQPGSAFADQLLGHLPQHQAAVRAAAPGLHASPQHHAAPTAAAPAEHATAPDAVVAKYYVVQPPHGRRYDSLWDISERTLRDPLRYKEIFALNKDRIQADGRKLIDANLIQPGWELQLPADASGPGVHVVHATAPAKRAAAPAAHPAQHLAGHPAAATHPAAAKAEGTAAAHSATALGFVADPAITAPFAPEQAPTAPATPVAPHLETAQHGSSVDLGSLALGGGLMVAGLLVALRAKRGPYAEPAQDEAALALAADPDLALLLDRALRNLSAARSAQGRPLPEPVVAWAGNDRITLNLAGGDAAEPPAPWHLGDDARSWTAGLAAAAAAPVADVAAPFPGLLSVGRHDDYEVFVDFEQAPGLISVGGDTEQGRSFAAALAVQAATSLWSDGARVSLVGFGDGAELAEVDPRAIHHVDHLSTVLTALTDEHEAVLALQRRLGVDGVLSGRQVRRTSTWQPQLVILSGPPTVEETARLQALCSGRSNVVVLVVGDLPNPRWRFAIDGSGRIDLGLLGATAQAHRLDRAAVRRLVELVAAAGRAGVTASTGMVALTPQLAAAALAPAPLTLPDATVSITLLGPVQVTANGPVAPSRQALLTEVVVAVALHPEGLHDAVLRASLWPRGVSDEVCAATMTEAASWLGADAHGQPCLTRTDGRWHLSAAVSTDWDELRALAAAGDDDLPSLLRAVALIRGEAFSDTPPGRYGWLAFARAAREARVVATTVVRRAAALLVAQGRAVEAEQALRQGLLLVPTAELLWRELLLIAGRGPEGPAAAGAVADELYATLHRHRAWPEPETDALVAQLAPDRAVDRTG